ncbi:MAG: ABC transporter ATP-binding protein [Bacillota bacterium]|nr:ABC transporter ATP-binding protein [Bacillota bacterium]
MDSLIWTDNVNRYFKSGTEKLHVLKNISISIEPKSLTILKGRSGSGKTTLINLLSVLDRPDSGEIFFDGIKVTALNERERDKVRRSNMGFVFQAVSLISLMSAYENVEFGLRVAGFDTSKRQKRAEECLNLVGLQKRMNHRVHELSGGEQQRVAIARAIAHKPKVIFADEPTAELDSHMGLQVMKLFKDLVTNDGITVVMSSHDPNIIELADHVYSLQDGEIVNE